MTSTVDRPTQARAPARATGVPPATGVPGDAPAAMPRLVERLAPFVAWLATQDLDEATRRRYREAAEAFLQWSLRDQGSPASRRRRYEGDLADRDPAALQTARPGLDYLAQHQYIVAVTLPVSD